MSQNMDDNDDGSDENEYYDMERDLRGERR